MSRKAATRAARCNMAIRLLVVDDDPGFRETLRGLLAQREEAVVLGEAGSGEEALRLAEALQPDVVLMDLAMPRMNGLEATRRLKARWPGMAVIIITIHDEGAYRRTALAAGAEVCLEKKTLGVNLWPTLNRLPGGSRRDPRRWSRTARGWGFLPARRSTREVGGPDSTWMLRRHEAPIGKVPVTF